MSTSETNTEVDCPSCDRDDFVSVKGMKQHHSQAHGESIAGVEVVCDWCDDKFRRSRTSVEGNDHVFCSDGCEGSWRSEHTGGDSHYLSNHISVECDWCGDNFTRREGHVNNGNNFCSRKCHGESASDRFVGENHPNYSQIELDCEWCQDTYKVPQCRRDSRFCGNDCKYASLAEQMSGEEHHNWNGGMNPYGDGWNEKRRHGVRRRDGFNCQSCGMSQEEHLDEYDTRLHVHHITPARDFDDPEPRNDPSNLISLCAMCHTKVESGSKPSPTPAAD